MPCLINWSERYKFAVILINCLLFFLKSNTPWFIFTLRTKPSCLVDLSSVWNETGFLFAQLKHPTASVSLLNLRSLQNSWRWYSYDMFLSFLLDIRTPKVGVVWACSRNYSHLPKGWKFQIYFVRESSVVLLRALTSSNNFPNLDWTQSSFMWFKCNLGVSACHVCFEVENAFLENIYFLQYIFYNTFSTNISSLALGGRRLNASDEFIMAGTFETCLNSNFLNNSIVVNDIICMLKVLPTHIRSLVAENQINPKTKYTNYFHTLLRMESNHIVVLHWRIYPD